MPYDPCGLVAHWQRTNADAQMRAAAPPTPPPPPLGAPMPYDNLNWYRNMRQFYRDRWDWQPAHLRTSWPTALYRMWRTDAHMRHPRYASRLLTRSAYVALVGWANQLSGWYAPARQAARALGANDPPSFYPDSSPPELRIAAMYVVQHAPPTRRWTRRRARCIAFLTSHT